MLPRGGLPSTERSLTMPELIEDLLSRNLHEVFGERDAGRRRAAIRRLFTEDCVFSAPDGEKAGQEALDEAVAALHRKLPEFVFTEGGKPQAIPGAGRLAWGFGPAGEAPSITGLDFIVVRAGRIAALYTFLDPRKP
jgi:hypothetical protein